MHQAIRKNRRRSQQQPDSLVTVKAPFLGVALGCALLLNGIAFVSIAHSPIPASCLAAV
jgi:hypothetical protein